MCLLCTPDWVHPDEASRHHQRQGCPGYQQGQVPVQQRVHRAAHHHRDHPGTATCWSACGDSLGDVCLVSRLRSKSEIIYICCTFNFVYFIGSAIYEFKTPTEYFKGHLFLSKTKKTQIWFSTNISIVVKPRNFVPMILNDFTVYHWRLLFSSITSQTIVM